MKQSSFLQSKEGLDEEPVTVSDDYSCADFFILFHYKPMYGAIIAFKDYTPALGIAESPWVGWDNFTRFSAVYILDV